MAVPFEPSTLAACQSGYCRVSRLSANRLVPCHLVASSPGGHLVPLCRVVSVGQGCQVLAYLHIALAVRPLSRQSLARRWAPSLVALAPPPSTLPAFWWPEQLGGVARLRLGEYKVGLHSGYHQLVLNVCARVIWWLIDSQCDLKVYIDSVTLLLWE